MRIRINERLRPFSHAPGIYCLLPYTTLQFQIFPSLIRISDFEQRESQQVREMALNIKGPVKEFTVQQDLERGWIRVWGMSAKGFFRYRILSQGVQIETEPEGGLQFTSSITFVNQKETPLPQKERERLSLGCHKSQEWEMVERRCDMAEIFPFWLHLSNLTPEVSKAEGGMNLLLDRCSNLVQLSDRVSIVDAFRNVFISGFAGILSPRLQDFKYQGLDLSKPSGSPLWMLKRGGELIRSLFIQEQEHGTAILPTVPKEFHCGRMKSFATQEAQFDIEWSKKQLRRMVVTSKNAVELNLKLPKGIRHFRVRKEERSQGTVLKAGTPIVFEKSKTLFLDHFEH